MEHGKQDSTNLPITTDSRSGRREDTRLNGHLNLTFSGMDANHMVIESGVVTDLCRDGIGVRTERSLKPGMELAIFIHCPDSEDYLCVPEARVAWANGDRFGVSIRTMPPEDQERLRQIVALAPHQGPRLS